MSDDIEIKIEGPKLTPDKFEEAVRAFFTLLRGVTKNLNGHLEDADWSVRVESGSAVVMAHADTLNSKPAIFAITRGVQSLSSGVYVLPQGFTRDEVKAARNLASVIDDDGKLVRNIWMKNGDAPIALSYQIVKTADVILSGEKYVSFGSIEGRIETLQGREGYPLACYVVDPIYKRTVVCHFNKKELEDEVINNGFRKRVLVGGLIHYSSEGYPTSVDADHLRIFPEEKDLPTLEQIQAIYR